MSQPGQVPDHRIAEMQEQLRKLMEQNAQLRGTVDAVMAQNRQPQQQQPPAQTYFKPEVQEALDKMLNERLGQVVQTQTQQFRGAYNKLYEDFDELKFKNEHRDVNYEDYRGKIEALRQEKQQRGQYLTRDEAFKFIHYEETKGKRVEAPKTPEAKQPTFDPYLQKFVSEEVPAADQTQQPQAQQPQAPQAQQPQQAQTPPVVTPQGVQAPSPDFNLPAQGNMRPAANTAPSREPIGLDLATADVSQLEAFANKFGDIPL